MKKSIIALVALVTMLSLTACGETATSENTSEKAPEITTASDTADEEKTTETARQFESVRAVIDGVKANNEELAAQRIREKLGNVQEAISMSYVAKNYFGKTKTWLYQRLNGNKVNGKEARFSEAEARQLQEALHDLGQRLSSIILI